VLSTGGTLACDGGGKGFAGRPDAMAFHPVTEQWAVLRPMAHGRWYPSVIILGMGGCSSRPVWTKPATAATTP
jgi:hypothetical protein